MAKQIGKNDIDMGDRIGAGKKKLFVLDTNVLLHDHTCIFNFQENDIVIPITALEELDNFKKGDSTLNYHARELTRELDRLIGDSLFDKGVSLGKGRGILRIETGKPFSEEMKLSFNENTPDHRILAIASYLHKTEKTLPVILVTKDINLRMKAKSLGIASEDYLTDKVIDVAALEHSTKTIENVDDATIQEVYQNRFGSELTGLGIEPEANECLELRGSNSSALVIFKSQEKVYQQVDKSRAFGIEPRNLEQTFAMHVLRDGSIPLISLTGKAGTGKTLLALASALAQEAIYDQILLARPIIPLSNRDIGFLPGDIDAKIGPYMQPLFDNLAVIKNSLKGNAREVARIEELQRNERLIISPLAYIRGRNLSNTFMIIDEAQNLTPHEVKTVITRAAEGTKMVFTGDIYQIDHPYLDAQSNGLSYLYEKMHGQNLFAHVNLTKGERSQLSELASELL